MSPKSGSAVPLPISEMEVPPHDAAPPPRVGRPGRPAERGMHALSAALHYGYCMSYLTTLICPDFQDPVVVPLSR
jgi:hypothetical protein